MREAFIEAVEGEGLVRPGDRVLVAVSGGRDSVVLLHLFLSAAEALGYWCCVAHLDHGMRDESGDDASFVRRLCEKWHVPCFEGRADVPRVARDRGLGLEEAARHERRRFLQRVAQEQSCRVIALGHHRADQVETFLHRLLRGTGTAGLAAMRPQSGCFIRPLLSFSPERLADYACRHRIEHVEDASNLDPQFTRNRIRRQVLPLLREFQPALDRTVARLCGQLAREADFWSRCEQDALDALIVAGREECLRLDRVGLLDLHPALRPRIIRRALCHVRGDLKGIDAAHLARLERLAESGGAQEEVSLPRAWAGRRYEHFLVARQALSLPADFCLTIDGPGSWSLPGGGRVVVSLGDGTEGQDDPRVAQFSVELPFPLQVRNFRPGDRIALPRVAGRKKLKDLFIDDKVEKEVRRALPLVVRDGEVLWVAGLRRSCRHLPGGDAPQVLRIEFSSCPALDNWLVNSRGLC